jgi:formiminotetrahydrofolate cyclodeaminase
MQTADSPSVAGFVASIAAATPTPGGGAVAAVTGALAAALAEMVARLALVREPADSAAGFTQLAQSAQQVRNRLLALAIDDEAAFRAVIEARRGKDDAALQAAWRQAAQVPAEVVRLCREVAQLASRAAGEGPLSAVGDAVMAALLAAAAAAGSQLNLRLNVQAAGGPPHLWVLADDSSVVLKATQRAAVEARLVVEERLGGVKR